MSDAKTEVPAEVLKTIGGGDCTAQDYLDAASKLRESYNELVDFTSYVIGRISGSNE